MATTRLIPLHNRKGKSLAKSIRERIGYAENGKKTNEGELVTSYECAPQTCDREFLLSKREYLHIKGPERKRNVIAYQIRQSFKPGEVTPEEANRIGYETAMRWTKGNHAFIVATHIDRAHIHNHVIYNSTTLDGTHKWDDFLRSGHALRKVSDMVCLEHGLSVITPKQESATSHPRDFKLILDMQKIISKNKGANYELWAKRYNLKQTAKAICFLQEHGINTLSELIELTDSKTNCYNEISESLQKKQSRLTEISETKKAIANYARTRATFEAYKKSGYNKDFLEANREEILIHRASKEFFNSHNLKKLPKMKELSEEFGLILAEKRKEYADYKRAKAEMQDFLIARQNVENLLAGETKRKPAREERT